MATQTVTSEALNSLIAKGCEMLKAVRERGEDPFEGCSDHLLVVKSGSKYFIVGDSLRDVGLLNSLGSRGIKPEPREMDHSACSIGLGADGKWYGWSHRAIVGFGVGDALFDARCLDPESPQYMKGAEDTPFVKLGHKTIRTESQARQAAENFAEYMS